MREMGKPTGDGAVLGASAAAALVVGTQVASKVARDALFLAAFPSRDLPKVMTAAAVLSLAVAFLASRAMTRLGPARVVPTALVASGALFLGELAIATRSPGTAALVVYLHVAALGGLLVSGFWSVVTERFDPHRAKRVIGRIGSGGTLGGVLGGVVADGTTRLAGGRGLLVVLAIASVAGAFAVSRFGRAPAPEATKRDDDERPTLRSLVTSSHLVSLGGLGVAAAVWAPLLDYGFKSRVAAAFPDGAALFTFFGWYYTVTSVLTFLVQSLLGHRVLTRYGLTVSVVLLPLFVTVGGLACAALPILATIAAVRSSESILGNSLYRSGYELYFTPLPATTKRAAKTLLDVAATRLGDGVGSGLVLLGVTAWPDLPHAVPFVAASVVAIAALALVPRLHGGYVSSLEAALRAGAVDLEDDETSLDATTRSTIAATTSSLDRDRVLAEIERYRREHLEPRPAASGDDPVATQARALLGGDVDRAREALDAGIDPALARLVVPLLAREALAEPARRALASLASKATGALEDALLDERLEVKLRARLPEILAGARTERARQALVRGLDARDVLVRLASAGAIAAIARGAPELAMGLEKTCELVAGALDKDAGGPLASFAAAEALLPVPAAVASRLDPLVLLALTLLSGVVDPEAVALAARAIAGTDRALRGTALEYLENVVASPARERLLARIGKKPEASAPRRSERELVEALYRSRSD